MLHLLFKKKKETLEDIGLPKSDLLDLQNQLGLEKLRNEILYYQKALGKFSVIYSTRWLNNVQKIWTKRNM